jgi:hypothetical protein
MQTDKSFSPSEYLAFQVEQEIGQGERVSINWSRNWSFERHCKTYGRSESMLPTAIYIKLKWISTMTR